ncbi:MAG: bifunctional adenosylcobinamide kinase/adenosylcobinamide-phosphate guanylyltransferase [Bacteroidota bacterium]|nr:bifunctional adenosylcobinamide kinase/adenosylcobinamide-phosphate guanylyltransferase [Bacteroidota bacterium]
MQTGNNTRISREDGNIIFITGGARSGKSRYAQQLALSLTDSPVYIATAKIWDEDFAQRVSRHKAERDERWTNFEEQRNVSKLPVDNRVCIIDCVTLWLSNFFSDTKRDIELSLQLFKSEIDALVQKPGVFIIISNETGMGIHAETEIGRKFTDLQGWANQYVAAKAAKVIFMISGIPVTIKTNTA